MLTYDLEDTNREKIYTFLYIIESTKVVKVKTFLNFQDLKDYKNFYVPELKKSELNQVDKDGYVWFSEVIGND